MDAESVAVPDGTLQRGHSPGEAFRHELCVEDGAIPEDREPIGKPSEADGKRPMPLPVPELAAPVARLDDAIRPKDDQPAHPVHLRLDRIAPRVGDRRSEDAKPVVRDELREDIEHQTRVLGERAPVPPSPGGTRSPREPPQLHLTTP